MRRRCALLPAGSLAAWVALAAPARPQEPGDLVPHYWPSRSVGVPVRVERLADLPNKPSELQLYHRSADGGKFQKGPRLPVNGLVPIGGGKKGFQFPAEADGDYEFAVQLIYPNGDVSPREVELRPEQRVVVDTKPPAVRVVASGNGVEWRAADDNLDPRPKTVRLQHKWPTSSTWADVTGREFRASGSYSWDLPAGKVLDVRVIAADRAGNEGVSAPVRIPADAGQPVGLPKGPADPTGGNPHLPAARVDYVNTLKFDVDYAVHRMGPSGVQAAHLFVIKSTGGWELVKRFPLNPPLMPADKERSLSLPYTAPEDGTYGFYVLPESGAGKRGEDPKGNDPPMVHVVVDTSPPFVQITGVQVRRGGSRGAVVDITWKAADPNLMPEPISLEWSADPKAGRWNEIKYRLRNDLSRETGRFTWEVPDENLWRFYVRARAVDKATNTGEHVWGVDSQGKSPPAEVIVDLETPSATINKVRGGNAPPAPGGSGSDAPPKKAPAKEPAKKKDPPPAADPPKAPDGPPALPELPPSPPVPPPGG